MICDDLLEWLKTLLIWMQKAYDYSDIYDLFKIENGLSDGTDIDELVTFSELIKASEEQSELYWKGVRNVHGVNALKCGESMDITLRLTSVYGENGNGKSGYTRLFNNVFCVISNAMILKAAFPETSIVVDSSCCAGVSVESHRCALSAMEMCQIEVR